MKHCKICDVDVDTFKNYCPLCYGSLEEKSEKNNAEMFDLNSKKQLSKAKSLVVKTFLLISIIVTVVCGYINYQTQTKPWSVIVALSILYLWVLVAHTIMSKSTVFRKVLYEVVSVGAILFASNRFFSNTEWFTNFVFPGLALLTAFVMLFVVFCSKNRKEYVFGFFRVDVLLILASILLLAFKTDDFKLINQINIIVQSIISLAYLIFAGKTIKTQASRKFHL